MFNLNIKLFERTIPFMVSLEPHKLIVQEIRLKTDQINEVMLHYLRCQVKKGQSDKWSVFELKCLDFYENIIGYLLNCL